MDGFAEMVGGEVGLGIDAIGKHKGLTQVGWVGAEMRIVPPANGDRVVGKGFEEICILLG